jgi:GDP-D-mannose 3',5'-epimerase
VNWSATRVLVTGGAGHIGSALVERLVNQGAHVKVADNLWRGSKEFLLDGDEKPIIDLKNDFLEIDLRDYKNADLAMKDTDVVFHLADVVAGITFVFDNLAFVYRSNALINSNVFYSAEQNHVEKLVYVGAACAYPHYKQNNPDQPLFKEEDMYPAQPESAYGWSKLMGEYECELYSKSGALSTAILRLHNVYGPHSDLSPERSQVIPATIRKAIRYPNEKFIIWGNGDQNRSFVYVSDVVDALMLAVEKGLDRGPIQIGTQNKTTIEEIADKVIEIAGKRIVKEHDLSKPVGDMGRAADCTLAEMLLGWKPRVTLEEGLRKTYDWAFQYLKKCGSI